MLILHTSDWHLGRTLYGRKRYDEFQAFLAWLLAVIRERRVEVLVVAGDIFDTTTPSNRAQELYYRLLCQVAASSCRHVVIIAGNHDSPSLLNAPRELLKALNVHVIGAAPSDPDKEVLVLTDEHDRPELIVCAVPYLRDRDLRLSEAGEDVCDKQRKMMDGIRNHYAEVATRATEKQKALGLDLPIIGTGHLFTAGGKTADGDGVRDLYVGSLIHVGPAAFPDCFDYLALGHLHVPQQVYGQSTIRYSGSPLPMGFGEAGQGKSVCLIECAGSTRVETVPIPVFQELIQLQGDWPTIAQALESLKTADSSAWLEIIYQGDAVISDLRDLLDQAVAKSDLEILRIKNIRIIDQALAQGSNQETLDDLSPEEVFHRCLTAHAVPEEQQANLIRTYQEALLHLHEDDSHAE